MNHPIPASWRSDVHKKHRICTNVRMIRCSARREALYARACYLFRMYSIMDVMLNMYVARSWIPETRATTVTVATTKTKHCQAGTQA